MSMAHTLILKVRTQNFHSKIEKQLSKEETQKLKLLNPYELRIKALDEKLEPYELGRVLFNLSVRRGFKSNRKDGSQEEQKENSKSEKMSQGDKCNNLENAIRASALLIITSFER